MSAHLRLHGYDHFFVPYLGEAAPRTILSHPKIRQRGVVNDQSHLLLQALAPFFPARPGADITEIDYVNDGKDGDLEQNGVQPRPAHGDVDFAWHGRLSNFDALLGHMKQPKKVDEIALQEAQSVQILKFGFGETKLSQFVDFGAYFVQEARQIDIRRTALVSVFDLRGREMMQYDLHHGELVRNGIE